MRAKLPSKEGFVERDGVKLHYEIYGDGPQTMVFVPPWVIVHSRIYKAQLPYFSERFRCITYDGRGNGQSDRPEDVAAYSLDNYVADVLAVMDATDAGQAILVGLSYGGLLASILAAHHPERVKAAILAGTVATVGPELSVHGAEHFLAKRESFEGWEKFNRAHWLADYPDFAEHFVRHICTEPHSTKQIEDGIAWAADTTGRVLAKTVEARTIPPSFDVSEAMYRKISCPMLLLHGDDDQIQHPGRAEAVAKLVKGAERVTLPGGGHNVLGRFPAKANTLIMDFLARKLGLGANTGANTGAKRPAGRTAKAKRALYLSSPIGLGHGRRDIAIARELRKLHPDLEVDWLAQDPVTRLLAASGERIHPLSARLASETRHIELEVGRARPALLRGAAPHGRGADRQLHDLPGCRRRGRLRSGDRRRILGHRPILARASGTEEGQARLVDRLRRLRADAGRRRARGLFDGRLQRRDDRPHRAPSRSARPRHLRRQPRGHHRPLVRQGPAGNARLGAPHFDFSGYILGEHPETFGGRAELRHSLGYRPDERVCIVTVGGSGVGTHLIKRILQSYPMARARLPELRMILVAGPRIDPQSLAAPAGVEVRDFVPNLDRHLAACDLALVQGGLTTCMELTAAGTPFLYFPLKNHFEQNFHVAHRLDQYGAGRRMEFATSTPDMIAEAMVAALAAPTHFKPVEAEGAARAARMLADLV